MSGERRQIAIVGGGAAGFFAAIHCAEHDHTARVTLLEVGAQPLAKVRISGGGRCNVTHACFEPREFVTRYPRGARELLGPLHRFGPRETMDWFERRGVALKIEADGRVFPVTDDSATIVDCLQRAAHEAGVQVALRCGVRTVTRRQQGGGFELMLHGGSRLIADRVLLATGGAKDSAGIAIAAAMTHHIEPQVPSLFTLRIDDARLRGLAGVAVPDAVVSVRGSNHDAAGAVLITHRGLSGPGILRLSAWAARELHACNYRFDLVVNWAGSCSQESVLAQLAAARTTHARRQLASVNFAGLPARLWERLVEAGGVRSDLPYAEMSNAHRHALATQLTESVLAVNGRDANKDEFVTCGGVRLREVDFRTMQSRLCPGLFFAGEILDIDGLTGGFNFQAAWTTGAIAGHAMASV